MRHFSKPTGIDRLSLEARVVYTVFCAFMLLGYASSAWLFSDSGLLRASRYYLGDTGSGAAVAPAGDGPALDLPDDAPTEIRLAKPPRQVMETFHFHLFSVPVCLLIVSHIFMMCGLASRTKVLVIGVTSAATFVHLITPPLIRFVSPAFAPLMAPGAIVSGAGWTWMTLQPVLEMWRPRRVRDVED